jgi:hypothetical protein
MRRDDRRRRDRVRDDLRRKARPRVEGLEGRLLLYATTGAAWPHPAVVTYSFVPDGTNIGGYASNLFQTLNAKWPTATWQGIFGQAAAIWEQVANVNFTRIGDSGAPLGFGLFQQGDSTMGDIRISGLPSSVIGGGTLGYTLLPPPINGGSEAGDVIMNTSQPWQINADYDLLTVAIHELGHALGMDHSAISTADMYAVYNGGKQSLTADDIAGIDSIYGPRQPDAFMTYFNNSTSANAFDLTPYVNLLGQVGITGLDIQNSNQTEWFKVTAPLVTTGTLSVTVQSTNLSLLSPGVQIESASLKVLGAASAFSNYQGATVTATISGVTPGQVFYIHTGAAVGGATGAGNYGILANFGLSQLFPIPSPATGALVTGSNGGGLTEKTNGNGNGNGHGHGHGHDDNVTGIRGLDDFAGDALTFGDGASLAPGSAAQPGPLLLIAPTDPTDDGASWMTPAGPRWLTNKANSAGRTALLSN